MSDYTVLSRRQAARLMLTLSAGAALAACANQTTDQLTQDVNLIVSGLNSVIPTLQGLPANLQPPATVIAQVQSALDDINANAGAIGTALSPNASVINHIAQVISTISALLSVFFPVAPTLNAIFQAIWALLPGIIAMVNGPMPAGAMKSGMSPAAARIQLAATRR